MYFLYCQIGKLYCIGKMPKIMNVTLFSKKIFYIFFFNFRLDNWALSFGKTLYETARAATRFDAIQKVCSILMNSNF